MTLPSRLRAIREKKGLTQHELGDICQVDSNQISRYERGTVDPTIHTLRAIADHLEVSSDYLLGLTDDPTVQIREPGMNPAERDLLEIFRREGWPGVFHLGAASIQKMLGAEDLQPKS
jgi:transcriptional regulator with XRE-family HTH domain